VEAVRQIVWTGTGSFPTSRLWPESTTSTVRPPIASRGSWGSYLRAAHERLGQEHEQARTALASIRTSHETLAREREHLARELDDMRERHEAVMRERHRAGEELEAILRRFRASA
jgi:chromosome segregation ATPase